jgi:hypothetical protein
LVQFSLGFKPFPWPAVTEDLGAASAAAFFNLLLVWGCDRHMKHKLSHEPYDMNVYLTRRLTVHMPNLLLVWRLQACVPTT